MLNRRTFLQTSTAALTAIASTNPALAKIISKQREHVIDTVIYDGRFTEGADFASEASHEGATLIAVGEDLTEESYLALLDKFRSQESVVAGLTPAPVANYIKAIARDNAYQQIQKTELLSLQDNSQNLVTWVMAPVRA